jgi:hypothetical protein
VGLPFLAVQLIQMMRADKREAAEIDAVLDARDAERAAARAAMETRPGVGAVPAAAPAAGPAAAAGDRAAGDQAGVAVSSVTSEPDDAAEPERPWWESDPRITSRFKKA